MPIARQFRSNYFTILIYATIAITYLFNIGVIGETSPTSTDSETIIAPLLRPLLTLQQSYPTLALVISAALIILGATLVMRLSIRFNLYAGALHTPSVIYPAIVVALIDREQMIIAPLTATIVLFALFKLYDAYNSHDSTPRIFSGLFAISTLTMIYPVTLPLLLILLVTMVILDRDMHDMLVGTLSILMPFGIALYICWLCEIPIDSVTEEYFEAITAPHYRLCEMLPQVIYITLTALISLYGLLQLDSISIALVSRTRITFAAVLAILGVGLFAIPALSTVEYITMAAPASIAISAALLAMKQRWATILYLIFILAGTALAVIRVF